MAGAPLRDAATREQRRSVAYVRGDDVNAGVAAGRDAVSGDDGMAIIYLRVIHLPATRTRRVRFDNTGEHFRRARTPDILWWRGQHRAAARAHLYALRWRSSTRAAEHRAFLATRGGHFAHFLLYTTSHLSLSLTLSISLHQQPSLYYIPAHTPFLPPFSVWPAFTMPVPSYSLYSCCYLCLSLCILHALCILLFLLCVTCVPSFIPTL